MPIFDHTQLKSIKVTFSFPEVASICKKSVCSIYSFLKYKLILEFRMWVVTPILDHAYPIIF